LTIYIPISKSHSRRAIVVPGLEPHSHPIFPSVKVPFRIKEIYLKCVEMHGALGATALRVDKAACTRSLLEGKLPQEVHPSLVNDRNRRKIVSVAKKNQYSSGKGLAEADDQLGKDSQYIRSISVLADNTHVIVTLHPKLAEYLLHAQWIMVDTTFKFVHGKTNVWKVLMWHNGVNRRVIAGRVYCNRATEDAFYHVWDGLFSGVKAATGKPLRFKIFDKLGSLLGICGDAEAAQVLGLARFLQNTHANDPTKTGIQSQDGVELVQYVFRLCWVHWCRGIQKLESSLSKVDTTRLREFPRLVDPSEIQNFYEWINGNQPKAVKDWWQHKLQHAWLLPAICDHSSRMPKQYRDLIPPDTNSLEGSHASDNLVSSTNNEILQAIMLAWKIDDDAVRVLKAAMSTGVLPNHLRTLEHRTTTNVQRRDAKRRKIEAAKEVDHEVIDLTTTVEDAQSAIKDAQQVMKGAKERLKEIKVSKKSGTSKPGSVRSVTVDQRTVTRRKSSGKSPLPNFTTIFCLISVQ
ncbi:hypothetical protein SCHPADRAFT_838781, partial [Schizopora paradoxa]